MYTIGDKVVLKGNPFDEQIPWEMDRYLDQAKKVQKVTETQVVPHGQWVKTDLNSSWIDSAWFQRVEDRKDIDLFDKNGERVTYAMLGADFKYGDPIKFNNWEFQLDKETHRYIATTDLK